MCGIAGIWRQRGDIDPQADLGDLQAMLAAGAHRGPDGTGQWHMGPVALGHQRLAILDPLARSAQPMHAADGGSVLCFNGEVYNYRELRSELEAAGLRFHTRSDTEVVLEALQHWGPAQAIPRFNGMFAIAWFDRRARRLWLARDRLGIKPLSLAWHRDRFLFASEDKMLLAASAFPAAVDSREMTLRLAGQNRDGTASLFTAIRRLPPAALWCVHAGGIEESCWWHALEALDPQRLLQAERSSGRRLTELQSLLEGSVALHCAADASLATACSGGIDSGLITALAARYRDPLQALVIDPDSGFNESAAAAETASAAGVPLRRVGLDSASYLRLWPQVVWQLESGGWSHSSVALLVLAQYCQEEGLKVLLTGEGADELFGGYRWQRVSARRFAAVSGWRGWLRGPRSRAGRLHRLLAAPFERSAGKGSAEESMAMLRALDPAQGALQRTIFEHLAPVPALPDRAFLGSCIYDLYTHLQDLLHRHDRLSMAASVELRVPFLENRLIDFALHLNRPDKYRSGTSKWLLRKAAAAYLPPSRISAPKQGFPVSADYSRGSEALLADGLLRELLRWSRDDVRAVSALAGADAQSRMRLVGMEMFMRLYMDGATVESLGGELLAACGGSEAIRE